MQLRLPAKELAPEEDEAPAPKAKQLPLPDARRVHLSSCARSQRRDETWVSERYQARYGELPPLDCLEPLGEPSSEHALTL